MNLAPEVLLKETYQYIVDHPEEHNQQVWVSRTDKCGTVCCFAGHAVLIAGYKVDRCNRVSEMNMHVMDAAQKLLGLTDHQVDQLFLYADDIHDIKNLLEDWKVL